MRSKTEDDEELVLDFRLLHELVLPLPEDVGVRERRGKQPSTHDDSRASGAVTLSVSAIADWQVQKWSVTRSGVNASTKNKTPKT